jgi:hypothetical protein
VIRTVGSLWLWTNVECSAEIITTTAAANDSQSGYLSGKFPFTLVDEEIAKLVCEYRQYLDKQRRLPQHLFNYPISD